MRNLGKLLAFVMLLAVTSCETAYQERGLTGGWEEKKVNDSAWIVSFGGNGHTSKDHVWYFFMNRCAELTLQNGYRYFVIRPVGTVNTSGNSGVLQNATYHPGSTAHLMKVHAGGGPVFIYGGGGTITNYSNRGVVLMFKDPLPASMLWANDAAAITGALSRFIKNGSNPPSRVSLIEQAFAAHARLSFDALDVSGLTPGPTGLVLPRSADDFRAIFSNYRLPFYKAFQEHVQRTPEIRAGRIVLAFDVSSNGIVSNARLVSSTYPDVAFNEMVLARLETTEFGAADVQDTRVNQLAITFVPNHG